MLRLGAAGGRKYEKFFGAHMKVCWSPQLTEGNPVRIYSLTIMNQTQPQPTTPETPIPQPIPPKPKTKPLYWIILIVVAIIAIAGTTCAIWYGQKEMIEIQETIIQPSQLPEAKPSPTADLSRDEVLRDWQTYRNEEYGFEVKYPEDWFLKYFGYADKRTVDLTEFGNKPISKLGDGHISINVQSLLLYHGFTLEDIATEFELPHFEGKMTTFNGKKAIEYTAVTDKKIKAISILYNPGSNRVYNITARDENYFPIFNQILSTFKFLK